MASSTLKSSATMLKTGAQNVFLSQGLPYKIFAPSSASNSHAVGRWLLGTAGCVFGMVSVGGLTRLTQSGLSMTTWTPLGGLPPMSETEWQDEFSRYRAFPEWQQRQNMTLSEFKYIYAWEYGHRMLGRLIGLIYVGPWAYFTVRGKIPAGWQPRLALLGCMGATQGLIGWWMVKSGLGDDRRSDKHEIRVTPVRLTTHLSMAAATYGLLCWTAWDMFSLNNAKLMVAQVSAQPSVVLQTAAKLRIPAILLSALTAVTMTSGALVAGNDAGRAFNTWPLMDGGWIPSEYGQLQPWSRNIYEHTPSVQWHHRMLATTTTAVAATVAVIGLKHRAFVTPQVKQGLVAVGVFTSAQFTLGIVTLINYVPIPLAAAHQLGSLAVFTSSLYLVHSLRYVRPKILRLVTKAK